MTLKPAHFRQCDQERVRLGALTDKWQVADENAMSSGRCAISKPDDIRVMTGRVTNKSKLLKSCEAGGVSVAGWVTKEGRRLVSVGSLCSCHLRAGAQAMAPRRITESLDVRPTNHH
jgi:hypothetical protein